jgi:small subunit ribosomal protein S2
MSTSSSSIIDRLFGAGAHFGFRKSRRHPTVVPFLFTSKEGNDIFDLEKSAVQLATASAVLEEAAKNGKVILFVGTKDEVGAIVKRQAELVGVPYVVNRWIGGMMTNFSEIKKRILRLETLIREKESGELDRKYTKKERVLINREVTKLQFNFGGIATITRPVDLMVIVDPRHDSIALEEAKDLKIPTVAIMSSDCDVSQVTYPVLVNDALQSSVSLVLSEFTSAIERGKAAFVPKPVAPRPAISTSTTSAPARINRRPRTAS